jgi:hypothetical protein
MRHRIVSVWLAGLAMLGAAELPSLHVPHTVQAPQIDGKLDDPGWAAAGVITGLQPAQGVPRSPAMDRLATEIRLLWDEQALYVAFRCADAEIYATGSIAHDGNIYMEDVCEIFLDPKGDGRQWIEIQVNPLNQTLDLITFCVGDAACQPNGRLVSTADLFSLREWEAAGLRTASGRLRDGDTESGWTVEMAIPAAVLTQRLGTKALAAGTMRANLMRYDHQPKPGTSERSLLHMNWSPVVHGCPHISPAAMGTLILDPAPAAGSGVP